MTYNVSNLSPGSIKRATQYAKRCEYMRNYYAKYRKEHPLLGEKQKEYNQSRRFKKYGITKTVFHQMLVDQNYKCAICSKSLVNVDVSIDHNHITGQTRSLLCHHCNSGIGFFNEDTTIISNVLRYLEKWK